MKKVLIVDDSAFMRMLLRQKLSDLEQTEIFEAANGKQAIETAKKQNPDLIFLDLILPDINGEIILSNLRKDGIKSKVIMITAVGQKPVIQRCKKLGISGYIIKPFDDTKIKELINKTINGELSLIIKQGKFTIDSSCITTGTQESPRTSVVG